MRQPNALLDNRPLLVVYAAIVVLLLIAQMMPARIVGQTAKHSNSISGVSKKTLTSASGNAITGWSLSVIQWQQFTRGLAYFGLMSNTGVNSIVPNNEVRLKTVAKQKIMLRVNSAASALFSIFMGLAVVLPPLVLLLLILQPKFAWWCTPTMFLSMLWWTSSSSLSGFYLTLLSLLGLWMLVVTTLINNQYFRTSLNAFAGQRSFPFHAPVLYIVLVIIITAIRS